MIRFCCGVVCFWGVEKAINLESWGWELRAATAAIGREADSGRESGPLDCLHGATHPTQAAMNKMHLVTT
jgi:hypothetical protein